MGSAQSAPRGRRHLPVRERLRFFNDWRFTEAEFGEVTNCVHQSGVVPILQTRLSRRRDSVLRLSVLGYLVALLLNGSHENHKASEIDITRILNGFGPAALGRLGMPNWMATGSYDRVWKLHRKVAAALKSGWEYLDPDTGERIWCDWRWFKSRLLLAPIPADIRKTMEGNVALAIDGTEVESCGQLHADVSSIELDGEAELPDDERAAPGDAQTSKRSRSKGTDRKVKVFGIGDDGRKIFTKDSGARAGYRTGNANHPGGKYNGRELHLGVAVPALLNTDGVNWVKFGPDVPKVVVTASLVPAGTHRAKAVLQPILDAQRVGLCHDIVADPGYSLSVGEFFHLPLQQARMPLTMQLVTHQRGEKPGLNSARQIDGHLFGEQLAEDLADLPMWPFGASEEEKQPYIEKFNKRAAHRYSRIKAPGADGTTRWQHPVNAGTLRSRHVCRSMRNSRRAPLIELDEDAVLATITAGADALPLWQPCLFGTSAWCTAYGRRQLVETANSLIHGATGSLTDISRKYTKLMNSERIELFVMFTLAGLNRRIIRNWQRDHRLLDSSDPEALSPRLVRRAPRRGRARHYEDLQALAGTGPAP
jgi:hypothetical protein